MPANLIEEFFPDSGAPEATKFEKYYPGSKRKLEERGTTPTEYVDDLWRKNFTVKRIFGVETRVYPVGALATALGVSVPTIRHWEEMGYLPVAPYRLPSNMKVKSRDSVAGRRLYTEELIIAVIEAFKKRGLINSQTRITWAKHRDLTIEIREEWARIIQNTPRSN